MQHLDKPTANELEKLADQNSSFINRGNQLSTKIEKVDISDDVMANVSSLKLNITADETNKSMTTECFEIGKKSPTISSTEVKKIVESKEADHHDQPLVQAQSAKHVVDADSQISKGSLSSIGKLRESRNRLQKELELPACESHCDLPLTPMKLNQKSEK